MRNLSQFVVLVLALLCTSCSQNSTKFNRGITKPALSTELRAESGLGVIRNVVVLPVEGDILSSQPDWVARNLTDRFIRNLELETEMEVRNSTEPNQVSKALSELSTGPLVSRASELNDRLQADGVFFISFSKFKESKKGDQVLGEVAFRVWFLEKGSKQAAWVATYEFSQQPLSDNLFRVKQALEEGLSFRGPGALAESGFKSLAKEFEILRMSSEKS